MTNTLARIEISTLPEHTSKARELQWQMENWQASRAQACIDREHAWKVYAEAIDNSDMSREEKEEIYQMATMFDEIADEAWRELDKAKTEYLQLLS
jgi:hypothetical protein